MYFKVKLTLNCVSQQKYTQKKILNKLYNLTWLFKAAIELRSETSTKLFTVYS